MTTWQYLKEHGYFTDKVSPEGFKFNKHGVCKNPEEEVIYIGKKHRIVFEYCCCNGAWDYGYELKIDYGSHRGSYGPCSHPAPSRDTQKRFADRPIYNRRYYSSREAVRKAAIDHAKKFLDEVTRDTPGHGVSKAYAALEAARTPQLTLF